MNLVDNFAVLVCLPSIPKSSEPWMIIDGEPVLKCAIAIVLAHMQERIVGSWVFRRDSEIVDRYPCQLIKHASSFYQIGFKDVEAAIAQARSVYEAYEVVHGSRKTQLPTDKAIVSFDLNDAALCNPSAVLELWATLKGEKFELSYKVRVKQ